MSVIPEVSSQYTGSPLPRSVDGDDDFGIRHQPSFSGSFRQPSSSHAPSIAPFVIEKRPVSRASFAVSHKNFVQEASNTSSPPDIDIQPPSRDESFKSDSLPGGSRRSTSSLASQIRILPPNAGERSSAKNGMPGGLTNNLSPTDLEPSLSHFTRSPRRGSSRLADEIGYEDDAVSSAFSAHTLTTPPGRYQAFGPEVGDAEGSGMGRPLSRFGSMNTTVYSAPDSSATEDMTGVGTLKQAKRKGKRK